MAIPWKAVFGGFVDGYSACLLIFRKEIRLPGSQSLELIGLTKPEMLAQYRATGPGWEEMILDMKEISLDLDRRYARMVRIIGCIEFAAIAGAICFLALHIRI